MAKITIKEKQFKIKNGEINLDLAAFKLQGEDLKQYKLSIYSRREADYQNKLDAISARENEFKEEKEALKKKYGFFGRLFNKRCRAEMKRINQNLKEIPQSYKQAKMETQYYVLKEFQDKDLTMTAKEKKALASIEKDIHPYIKNEWDRRREKEKEVNERASQAYKTYDQLKKEKEDERLGRTNAKKQLDLGDKIHKPVEKTETVRETSVKEKEIEKEQKVQEGPDLEK